MKKLFWKILMILIFLFMTLSPFWSVLLVMKCEAAVLSWSGAKYTNAVIFEHKTKSWYRKVGLEVKYDKL